MMTRANNLGFRGVEVFFERHYDHVQPDGSLHIRKGLLDSISKYQIRINAGDHEPPHVHVSLNNVQIASYYVSSGLPYHVKKKDAKMDALVKFWLQNEDNKRKARAEWARMTNRH